MNYFDYNLDELSGLLDNKEISSTELTKLCLENIAKNDDKIGAFLTVCEKEALERAKLCDKRIAEGKRLGKLDGIPYSLKDNICTQGIKTTCASRMLESFVPPYNATCFDKLERSGAILLGKVNMDEFAMGSTTAFSAFKITKNPLNTDYSPGGSSGGCASSVGAREVFFSIGTDTGGSIRQPASFCGLYGLKPTYGRISRNGLIAFASSFDTVGIVANHATDLQTILSEISGKDSLDATSLDSDFSLETEPYIDNLQNARIGIPKELFSDGIPVEIKQNLEKAVAFYENYGAKAELISIPEIFYAVECYYIICCAEASSNLARFDGIRYGYATNSFENLEQLYEKSRSEGFSDEVKRRILVGTYVLSDGYRERYYHKALTVRKMLTKAIETAFETYSVLISPTVPNTAYKLTDCNRCPVEMYMGDICTVPANLAGIPAISVPCGFDSKGLPIGFQLMGKKLSESRLINLAQLYEGQGNKS